MRKYLFCAQGPKGWEYFPVELLFLLQEELAKQVAE